MTKVVRGDLSTWKPFYGIKWFGTTRKPPFLFLRISSLREAVANHFMPYRAFRYANIQIRGFFFFLLLPTTSNVVLRPLRSVGDPQNTIVNFITDSNNYARESFRESTISISNVKTTHFTFSGTSDGYQTEIELEGESTNLIECRGTSACQYLSIDASKAAKVQFAYL